MTDYYRILWIVVAMISALVFVGGILAIITGFLGASTASSSSTLISSISIISAGLVMVFMSFISLSRAIARL